MNRRVYEVLEQELAELNMQALPNTMQIARMKTLEKMLDDQREIYEMHTGVEIGDTRLLTDIHNMGMFLSSNDDDEDGMEFDDEELWDVEFSIPMQRDRDSDDYPIGETLLLLRWPDSQVYTFIKIDDDEYQCIYKYIDDEQFTME